MYFVLFCRKDCGSNKFANRILQLSKNTHLVMDESMAITTGQLRQSEVDTVFALFNRINTQSIIYEVNVNELNYKSDIPVLIVSGRECPLHVRYVLNNSLYFNITINSRATLLYACNLIK